MMSKKNSQKEEKNRANNFYTKKIDGWMLFG